MPVAPLGRLTLSPQDELALIQQIANPAASPEWQVYSKAGGFYVESPAGVVYGPLNAPLPSNSIALATCGAIPTNGNSLPWSAFVDQQGNALGVAGGPADPAVIAALAAIGLSVDATGKYFTVTAAGVFAIEVKAISAANPLHDSHIDIESSGVGGFVGNYTPGVTIRAGTPSGRFSVAVTDALIVGDAFDIYVNGTAGEKDLSSAEIGIVRIR